MNPNCQKQNEELTVMQKNIQELKGALNKLKDEVSIKSNIKDVCALVDMKANTEDLERCMDSIHKEIKLALLQPQVDLR